ncbi:MAG TPA: hypothetical protein PKL65_02170 [Bacteroidales bacterium]|jgi:homospermidine synthase|nr:hypothetical protein [Bacteroidales bacterium]HNR41011.1 hypothetical protein [Bacteroidales bacterium]HPM17609.1 hypothetical protein [Bacteroidales bacterium]HPV15772.1 hypothetical protein [Bacteroidales bacterium]HQG75871.1 hypothetical protein [Bacteroidales bacterium]
MKAFPNELDSGLSFKGNICMIGCGSIGQAFLPVIGRHLGGIYSRLTVLSACESGRRVAQGRGRYFPEKLDVQSPWQLQNIRSRQYHGE